MKMIFSFLSVPIKVVHIKEVLSKILLLATERCFSQPHFFFFFLQKQRAQSQLVNHTDNLNMIVKDSFAVTTKIQPSFLTRSIYPVSSMNTIKPLFFLETLMASSHWKS